VGATDPRPYRRRPYTRAVPRRLRPAVLLFLALVVLGAWVTSGASRGFDERLSLDVQARVSEAWGGVLETASVPVDAWYGYLSAVLLVLLVAWRAGPGPAWFVLGVGTSAVLLSAAAKWVFGRARPGAPIEVLVTQPASGSFPSGHVTWIAGFLGAAIYVLFRGASLRVRWGAVALLAAAILWMALSRVYLGQHFATDVLGGALTGAACLAAGATWSAARRR